MVDSDTNLIYEAYEDAYWNNEKNPETHSVKISFNEEDKFNAFVKFMEDIAELANAGASREIGIIDTSSREEREMKFFVDGDGNTRLKIEEC